MKNNKLTLIMGGARSGKSEFAEQWAAGMMVPVTYVATLFVGDEEMCQRVSAHKERRPTSWVTLEEPCYLPEQIREAGQEPGVILVDCLTGWISNLLLDENLPKPESTDKEKEEYIMSRVVDLVEAVNSSNAGVLMVSNEVGMGLVPHYPLGRAFRDISGKVNRYLASVADEVYLVVAGLAVEIKSLAVNLGAGDRRQETGDRRKT